MQEEQLDPVHFSKGLFGGGGIGRGVRPYRPAACDAARAAAILILRQR